MKIAIDGMCCQSCVTRVRKALEKVEGAQIQGVEMGSAELSIDPAREAAALDAVRKAGYESRKSE